MSTEAPVEAYRGQVLKGLFFKKDEEENETHNACVVPSKRPEDSAVQFCLETVMLTSCFLAKISTIHPKFIKKFIRVNRN